jgi:hypothetical protein
MGPHLREDESEELASAVSLGIRRIKGSVH